MPDLNLRSKLDGSNFNQNMQKMGEVLEHFGTKVVAHSGHLGMFSKAFATIGTTAGAVGAAVLGIGTVMGLLINNMRHVNELAKEYISNLDKWARGSTSTAGAVEQLNGALRRGGVEGGPGSLMAGATGARRQALSNNPEAAAALKDLGMTREQAVLADQVKLVVMLAKAYDSAADKAKAYAALVKLVGEESATSIQKAAGNIKGVSGSGDMTERQIAAAEVARRRENTKIYFTQHGVKRLTKEEAAGMYEEESLLNRAARGINRLFTGRDDIQDQMDKNAQEQFARRRAAKREAEQEKAKEQNIRRIKKETISIEQEDGMINGRPARWEEIEAYRTKNQDAVIRQFESMKNQAAKQGRPVTSDEKTALVEKLDAIERMAESMERLRGQAAQVNPLKYGTDAEKLALGERFKPLSDSMTRIGLGSGGLSPAEVAEANRGIQMLRLQVLIERHLYDLARKAELDKKKMEINKPAAILGGD